MLQVRQDKTNNMNKETKKYIFVHIPKNAGKSVAKLINSGKLPNFVFCGHNYEVPKKHRSPRNEEVVILRDPCDRFISAFSYSKKYWHNDVNSQFSSASELAESAADPACAKHQLALIEMGNDEYCIKKRDGKYIRSHTVQEKQTKNTWIYEPQSTWCCNKPKHILRFEHLAEDFNKLMTKTGNKSCDYQMLGHINSSPHYDSQLSEKAIEFVKNYYKSDYEMLQQSIK